MEIHFSIAGWVAPLTCVMFQSPVQFLSQTEVLHSQSWLRAGGPTAQCLDTVYTVSHIGLDLSLLQILRLLLLSHPHQALASLSLYE